MSYALRRVERGTGKGLYWGGKFTVTKLKDAEVFPTGDGAVRVLDEMRRLTSWWYVGQIVTVEEAQAMDIASLL